MRTNEVCLSLIVMVIVTPPVFRGWKGIVPLHSTRTDVERQLGSPVHSCEEACVYKAANAKVVIVYSTGSCQPGDSNRWRVPAGTVISLIVYPARNQRLKDLNLNFKSFEKTKDPELPGHWVYTDVRAGVSYQVSRGRVLSIEWFPASRDDDSLACDP